MAKRLGRPPKSKEDKKPAPIGVRFPPALLDRLRESAKAAGRPLSWEIEKRLTDSFYAERPTRVGDEPTKALLDGVAILLDWIQGRTGGRPWYKDPLSYKRSIQAINDFLGYFRPSGAFAVPENDPLYQSLRAQGKSKKAAAAAILELPIGETESRYLLSELERVASGDLFESEIDPTALPQARRIREVGESLRALIRRRGEATDDFNRAMHKQGEKLRGLK
jgi:hypothetical protein